MTAPASHAELTCLLVMLHWPPSAAGTRTSALPFLAEHDISVTL